VPPRHRTLRETIEWSHSLLDAPEQQLFRRVSVFSGSCTGESLEAVCNTRRDLEIDVYDGIGALVDNSLVQRVADYEGEPRFVMLDTVREYGLERLAESADGDLVRRAHAAYCLVLAEEGNQATSVEEEQQWLSRCSVEHDNLRTAIDWLIHSQNAEWALRIGIALFPFWERRDHFVEGLEYLKGILELSGATGHIGERAMAASCAGALAADIADWQQCQSLLQQSLQHYREAGDRHGIAAQLNRIGANLGLEGKHHEAAVNLQQSVLAWQETGEPLIAAGVSCALAEVVSLAGDPTRASALLDEALSIFKASGDVMGAARALSYMGDAARHRGDSDAAHRHYEESLHAFHAAGDRGGVARSHVDLGVVQCDEGDLPSAASHFRQALLLFEDLGQRRGIARSLDGLASVASHGGSFQHALTLAAAADSIRRSVGVRLRAPDQVAVDETLRRARGHLDSLSADAAWHTGSRMSLRQAVDHAIASSTDL
jgi:tetratricopeptide (TPR) repeat protein